MAKKIVEIGNWCTTELKLVKTTFLWTVNHFEQLPHKTGEALKSSKFSVDCADQAEEDKTTTWILSIYPNGMTEQHKDFIGIFLNLCESRKTKVFADFRIALVGHNHQIRVEHQAKHEFRLGDNWGWSKFTCRPKSQSNNLIVNRRLIVFCEITETRNVTTTNGQRLSMKRKCNSLCDDIADLYKSSHSSDVKIEVDGHEFSVHKLILQARSSVFAAMFEHPMKENQENRVVIDDIDKEVFAKVLNFIYTDEVVHDDIGSCKKLLSAADKYNLEKLKYACAEYIGSHIGIESVSDILILADSHSVQELKTKTIQFINANLRAVTKTKGWKNIIDRTDLLNLF